MRTFIEGYLGGIGRIAQLLDVGAIEKMVRLLKELQASRGRLFLIGVGGSAAMCSHAANDFRKFAGIEAYALDSMSELTACVNDLSWSIVFAHWLMGCKLNSRDAVFVFSVGGGNRELNISANIAQALDYAGLVGAKTLGVVGRDGGHTAKMADACILVPTIDDGLITPFVESFHTVLLHLLVSHPDLRISAAKWESMK